MKLLLFFNLICISSTYSQDLTQFNHHRLQVDQRLMIGLGSWAGANFIASGVGWATAPNEEMRSFHQMNVMWNTVNIGLAIPGYFRAKRDAKTPLSFSETINAQHKTEKIFLVNSGLDIAYVSSGFILRSAAKTNAEKRDQFNGFGNGLILQGGFLLVFDLTAYFIHNRHRKTGLNPLLEKIELSDTGLGININLSSFRSQKTKL